MTDEEWELWGVERFEIDRGVDGPYVAAVHLFASPEALEQEGTATVMAAVPDYTNVTPVRQVAKVV